jgi:DNA-binding MarR family transcriptional regulator
MAGALLRMGHDAARARLVQALHANGFSEITQTEFALFQHPGPHGARPIELAARCNMSKQSLNYVLAQMEASGYIERGDDADGNRVVKLTRRGRKVVLVLRETMAAVEEEWKAKIGARRYAEFREVLQQIVNEERQSSPQPGAGIARHLPRRRRAA